MIHPFQMTTGVTMRGTDEASGALFSYVDLDERAPAGHPLRKIRQIVNDALTSLDAEFDALYTKEGRPSIAPERLIRASLLQMLFSIRSERQLMEQMDYNLLFRWFVGLGVDDPVWVPTVFSKNRDRLLTTEMSRRVMAAILAHPEVRPLLSDEHFSVDGTLVKAFATGLEPVATSWLTVHEELSAEGQRTAGLRRRSRRTVAATSPRAPRRHRPSIPTDRDPADARHASPDPQRRGELPG